MYPITHLFFYPVCLLHWLPPAHDDVHAGVYRVRPDVLRPQVVDVQHAWHRAGQARDLRQVLRFRRAPEQKARWVAFGQVVPRGAGTRNPKDAVEDISRISPRSTTTVGPAKWIEDQRFEHFPPFVGQVHASPRLEALIARALYPFAR
jgi:hypothetical protein